MIIRLLAGMRLMVLYDGCCSLGKPEFLFDFCMRLL